MNRFNLLMVGIGFAAVLPAQISVQLAPSTPSPAAVGRVVTWAARATGPGSQGKLWYRFSVVNWAGQSRVVKDFGPENTFEYAPIDDGEGSYAVEVLARNLTNGASASDFAYYQLRSNIEEDGGAVVQPSRHPLVFLYSAPACEAGQTMVVYYLTGEEAASQTPAKPCDGMHSMNFYLAGLRAGTEYLAVHAVYSEGQIVEVGEALPFATREANWNLPNMSVVGGSSSSPEQGVTVYAGAFATATVSDLAGNLIWFNPRYDASVVSVERGGYFWTISHNDDTPPEQQKLRLLDLAVVPVLETNAARVSEQLAAMGKRPISAFHHEARRLSNGWIVTLGAVERLMHDVQGAEGEVNILGDMIIVLDENLRVVWAWDAFDHLDVNRASTQDDKCAPGACPPLRLSDTANDWLHSNSVEETSDGNLMLSVRHQDWVLKIDYAMGNGSGAILWKLGKDGDFTIESNDQRPWFTHQHDARWLPNGKFGVYDNGNVRHGDDNSANSRGQVYEIDEAKRIARLVVNVDLGVYSFALGSVQLLDSGNYSFASGFLEDASGLVQEVTPDGKNLFTLRSSAPVYRAFRMRDLYTP